MDVAGTDVIDTPTGAGDPTIESLNPSTVGGHEWLSVDWFHDSDLPDGIPGVCDPGFSRLREYLEGFAGGLVVVGSGLETHLDLIRSLPNRFQGCHLSADQVQHLRDPEQWQQVVTGEGIRYPQTKRVLSGSDLPHPRRTGCWLLKNLRGAGGHHVRFLDPSSDPQPFPDGDWVAQELCAGQPLSVAFLSDSSGVQMLGVCRQILGRKEWGATTPFQYCGAIGPLPLPPRVEQALLDLGRKLTEQFGCRGLWGVDFVLDAEDRVWVIEINPRPTASMELLERAGHGNLMRRHLRAFASESSLRPFAIPDTCESAFRSHDGRAAPLASVGMTYAKAILYWNGSQPLRIDSRIGRYLALLGKRRLAADLPRRDTEIRSGLPILTVFAWGGDECSAARSLETRVERVLRRLRMAMIPHGARSEST